MTRTPDIQPNIEEVEKRLGELRDLWRNPPEGRSRVSYQLEAMPLVVVRDILLKKRPARGAPQQPWLFSPPPTDQAAGVESRLTIKEKDGPPTLPGQRTASSLASEV